MNLIFGGFFNHIVNVFPHLSREHCKAWLVQNFTFNFAEPVGGEITVTYESAILKGGPKTAMERALDAQMKKSKFAASSTEQPKGNRFYYTTIPRIIKHKGMSGQELTSMNLDKVTPLNNFSSLHFPKIL